MCIRDSVLLAFFKCLLFMCISFMYYYFVNSFMLIMIQAKQPNGPWLLMKTGSHSSIVTTIWHMCYVFCCRFHIKLIWHRRRRLAPLYVGSSKTLWLYDATIDVCVLTDYLLPCCDSWWSSQSYPAAFPVFGLMLPVIGHALVKLVRCW